MTIKVYSSIMPGEPDEVYHDHGTTVEDWVKSRTDNYQRGDAQPIACMINGSVVNPMDWCDAVIGEKDNVEFRVIPKGDALNFVFPFWAGTINVAADAAFQYLLPDIPGQPGAGQQGSQLEAARARANTARLGQAVPECFGQYIRYPDYVTQPRRYYKDTKTQALDLTLAIGVGEYQIDTSLIKIGETPVSDLGQAVTYAIHEPGDTLPAAYKNWYNSPEVGASTNSSGIRLEGVSANTINYEDTAADTDSNTISNIETDDLWSAGMEPVVTIYQDITITDGAPDADTLTGNFQHLSVDDVVALADYDDLFNGGSTRTEKVATLNASKTEMTLKDNVTGDPITDLDTGNFSMFVRVVGHIYTISSKTSTSLDFTAEDSGGSPVSVPFPDTTGSIVTLDFQIDEFDFLWSGPFASAPSGEQINAFEVDIFAPQGLGVIDGSNITSRSRDIEIQYRQAGSGSGWESVVETISGATRDQLGWTFSITPVGAITRPEVRIRRNDAEDTATTSLDRLEWIALRSELPRADSYADVTTMTMTIEGSDTIAGQSENRVNLEPLRKLPEISSGALTAPVATRKISAVAAYIPKSLGYSDSEIDLDELERLETTWTSRGDVFDYVFSDGTAKNAMDTVLRAGFAELTLDAGVLTPVRDEPRTIFEQGYSPENMTAPLQRQFQARQVDEPDGVEVEYVDADTWTEETVNAFLPGDLGVKLDKIRLDGVTDRTRAWRIGMRRRRAQRYRRWTYSFDTELDALNSSYLSYVPLLDDIPGYGKVCILEDIQSDRIVVSEPVEFVDGETHVVAYREADGTVTGPFTATQGPDDYTILVTIPQPWPEVLSPTQENTHVYFGTTDRWHFPALITEINPSGPLSVSVTASNYDSRVYDDDDSSPP